MPSTISSAVSVSDFSGDSPDMFRVIFILVIVYCIRVQGKPLSEEDDLTISDLRKLKDDTKEVDELSLDDFGSSEDNFGTSGEHKDTMESDEGDNGDFLTDEGLELEETMEKEADDSDHQMKSASKRQICDEIMNQLKKLPCDRPVVITCDGIERRPNFLCGAPRHGDVLRASLTPAEVMEEEADTYPEPAVLPGPPSPIMPNLPVNPPPMINNLQPVLPPPLPGMIFPPTRMLTEAEWRERQKRVFEGLLRFGTVVNQVDSFLTDKGKMVVRGLHRMIESEEDQRFS